MDKVTAAHKTEYEKKPSVIAMAPGRFHLIGEHSWFFKDKTLSMAVNLPVYVSVSRRDDQNLRFYFPQMKERKKSSIPSLKFKKEDKWANAIKSVVYGYNSGGMQCSGMNFTVYSDILPSAGFGITTAIKVAAAWAIRELYGFNVSDYDVVQVLERASRQFLGNENYKADNFTLIQSKENSIVLTDYTKNTCDIIEFPFTDKTIILTDARVPRISTWNEEVLQQPENVLLLGELRERRSNVYGGWRYEENSTEVNEVLSVVNEDTHRRLQCIMNEHRCVLDAETALRKQDFSGFARAVNRSHESMRDLYDISCPEIDWLLKRVQKLNENSDYIRNPESCGRITGKGFGRCTYTILNTSDIEKYQEKLADYERIFGFKPEFHIVKPAEGVKIL